MLYFGGKAASLFNDVVYFHFANISWCPLFVNSTGGPSGRVSSSAASIGSKFYIFGGTSDNSNGYSELWALDLGTSSLRFRLSHFPPFVYHD